MWIRILIAAVVAVSALPAAAEDDGRTAGLLDGHGRTEAAQVCTACHTAAEFVGERLTRTGWSMVMSTMVDEYGMEAPDVAVQEIVLTYLSEQFGPEKN